MATIVKMRDKIFEPINEQNASSSVLEHGCTWNSEQA